MLWLTPSAGAQSGALILLVPFGARSVGQGEAVMADSTLGTEGLWWNAAALARLPKKEVAIHHSQTIISTNDMITVAVPSKVLGTIAASAYLVNYGDQTNTGDNETPLGTISIRDYMLALSYATPIGRRLSAGVTYKFIIPRYQCTGICGPVPVFSGSTSALDIGGQYLLPIKHPVMVGATVRNLGPALQVKDAEQADPLPRVIQVGFRTRVPIKQLEQEKATFDVSADVLRASMEGASGAAIGLTLGYLDQAFLRAGYKMQSGRGAGPSIGVGFQRGSFGADITRRFDTFSSQVGEPPTYVSLRARF